MISNVFKHIKYKKEGDFYMKKNDIVIIVSFIILATAKILRFIGYFVFPILIFNGIDFPGFIDTILDSLEALSIASLAICFLIKFVSKNKKKM